MLNGCLDSAATGRCIEECLLEGGELAVLLCLCALIGCLALALPALAQTPADGNLEGQLDSLIRAQMRERKIVGVAVAVVRSGKVVAARALGDAKLRYESARPDTIFFLDSLTK